MFRVFIILLFIILLSACNKDAITSDGLHVYPRGSNSSSIVSFSFKIKGGERHLNKIDWGEDALPTSAKSCHHGGEISSPQRGIMKAFYDKDFIYLDISWDDKTKDSRTSRWKNNIFEANKDDGISVIFSKSPSFNCTETCHMSDWKVEEGKFYSDYRMFNDKDKNELILLRAEKTKGKPILAFMEKEGKKTKSGEDIFIVNSKTGYGKPFSFQLYQFLGSKDDAPYFSGKEDVFILNEKNQFLDGSLSFGFNRWRSEIKMPLNSLGLKNISKGDKIFFAIAVFDGTQINHSISDTFTATFE